MMLLFAWLASFSVMVVAADTDTSLLTPCAQGCAGNSTSQQAGCSNVDFKCLCSNLNYIGAIACCLSTKCSSDDQLKAVAFYSKLCISVNVTIPNFVGCSPLSLSKSAVSSSSTKSSQNGTSASKSATATGTIGSAVTITSSAPVARFTGGALLTGSCAAPQFASATTNGSLIIEYPWIGCSYERPSCCPYDVQVGGTLTICPKDYVTMSSACCPSGWAIYTEAFASQTPCYSTAPLPLLGPRITSLPPGASVSSITTKIFTLKYPLATRSNGGLSTGAKAAIAIGVVVSALAGMVLCSIFLLRRRQASPNGPMATRAFSIFRRQKVRRAAAAAEAKAATTADNRASTMSPNIAPLENLSELASPSGLAPTILPPPLPAAVVPTELPAAVPPPEELPGSTYLHEHHPAYGFAPAERQREREEWRPVFAGQGVSPEEVVSPIEEEGRGAWRNP